MAAEAAEVADAEALPLKRRREVVRVLRQPALRLLQAIQLPLSEEAAVLDVEGPAAIRKAPAAPPSQSIPTIRPHWENGRRRGAASGIRSSAGTALPHRGAS